MEERIEQLGRGSGSGSSLRRNVTQHRHEARWLTGFGSGETEQRGSESSETEQSGLDLLAEAIARDSKASEAITKALQRKPNRNEISKAVIKMALEYEISSDHEKKASDLFQSLIKEMNEDDNLSFFDKNVSAQDLPRTKEARQAFEKLQK